MRIRALMAQVRKAWQPPPRLTLSEWANQHAVLSAESSAEVGRWRTLPYQRSIMDATTDRHIEAVTMMKSARVGWSKMLNHTIGYHAHHEPRPLMLVQPTIGDAEGYSKDEIAPMIRDTPVLEALPLPGTHDAGNTTLRSRHVGSATRFRTVRTVTIHGLIFTGHENAFNGIRKCWGVTLIRDHCLRPAHSLTARDFPPSAEFARNFPSELARMRMLYGQAAVFAIDLDQCVRIRSGVASGRGTSGRRSGRHSRMEGRSGAVRRG